MGTMLSSASLQSTSSFIRLIRPSFLTRKYPELRLIVEPHTAHDHPTNPNLVVVSPEDNALLPLHTDLVITVGGDGTVLHTSNLFNGGECPPVLSFSMGSLGFLLPFRPSSYPITVPRVS